MAQNAKQIAVLGSGSWGTALAVHLCRQGHQVTLWGRDAALLKQIDDGENPRFFPNEKLPQELRTQSDLAQALNGQDALVLAVPSSAMRDLAKAISSGLSPRSLLVSTAKGLERSSNKRMSVVLEEELPAETRVAVLSGPSFALEVLRGKYTAITMASQKIEVAEAARDIFHGPQFRVYTSSDVTGVEFGGVFKNIIAIASGIVDGMELGDNARAALVTRGLAELQRFVTACGGERMTTIGLSGLGDLLLTTTGALSRNRQVGLRIGRGEKLPEIVADIKQVAEGVYSTDVVLQMAAEMQLDLPIVAAVGKILRGELNSAQAVKELFSRPAKVEN